MNNIEDIGKYLRDDTPEEIIATIRDALDYKSSEIKEILLREAAEKEPHYYYQYDGFADVRHPTDVTAPDGDGDEIYFISTWELKNRTNSVRVLIHESSNQKTVLRLLKKIRNQIKETSQRDINQSDRDGILKRARAEISFSDDIPF